MAPSGGTTWCHHLVPPPGATTWFHHMVPPRGATTWRHHPGPLTLPKSARNKDPPEGAGPDLVFFFFKIQWNHDGKIKTASKRKRKVKAVDCQHSETNRASTGTPRRPSAGTRSKSRLSRCIPIIEYSSDLGGSYLNQFDHRCTGCSRQYTSNDIRPGG